MQSDLCIGICQKKNRINALHNNINNKLLMINSYLYNKIPVVQEYCKDQLGVDIAHFRNKEKQVVIDYIKERLLQSFGVLFTLYDELLELNNNLSEYINTLLNKHIPFYNQNRRYSLPKTIREDPGENELDTGLTG